MRVTAPVLVAGKKSRTPALVVWSRFSHSFTSCCGYGREYDQDWNRCRQFGREPSWTRGFAVESARLA